MVGILFIYVCLLIHPVHVSLLSIDYNEEQRSFNVFLRIYFDDFLLDSGISDNEKKILRMDDDDQKTREFLGKYVNEKINILADSRQLLGVIGGYNLDDNELSMNLSYSSADKVTNLVVKNLIMTMLYPDQMNMLIIRYRDFEEGIRMTPEETEKTFRLKN